MQGFTIGEHVEVYREKLGEWVPGEVFDIKTEGGTTRYCVQLSGYVAMSASDPASWFTASQLRSA